MDQTIPIQQSITIMDAAMGTRLMACGLDYQVDDACLWNLTYPEQVLAIHRADLQAGAKILTTNTFGANPAWLERLGKQDLARQINRDAVRIARSAMSFEEKTDIFLVGSVGSSAFEDQRGLRNQVEELFDLGVDYVLLETLEASLIDRLTSWLAECDRGRIWTTFWNWGAAPDQIALQLRDAGFTDWGTNCVGNRDQLVKVHLALHRAGLSATVARPSMMPIPDLQKIPEQLTAYGLRYLGGCCGTDQETIRMWSKLTES